MTYNKIKIIISIIIKVGMITKDSQKIMFIIKQDSTYRTDDMQPENTFHSRPDPPGVRFGS